MTTGDGTAERTRRSVAVSGLTATVRGLDGLRALDRSDQLRVLLAPVLLVGVLGLHVSHRQRDDLSP